MHIHKKIVVDERGEPQEVIIPWSEYREIEEMLGFDLDAAAVDDLEEGRRDRAAGNLAAYVDLEDL